MSNILKKENFFSTLKYNCLNLNEMKKVLFVAVLAMCMVGCCKKAENGEKKCCEGEKKECCEKKCCKEAAEAADAEAPAEEAPVVEVPAEEAPAGE